MPEGELANATLQRAPACRLRSTRTASRSTSSTSYVNFGWEYVWHCHILSHEEMDMMRSQVGGGRAEGADVAVVRSVAGSGNNQRYVPDLDGQLEERDGLRRRAVLQPDRPVEHPGDGASRRSSASSRSSSTGIGPATGHADVRRRDPEHKDVYYYQVYAVNTVGDTWDYSNPAFNDIPPGGGFPTLTRRLAGAVTTSIVAAPVEPDGERGREERQDGHGHAELDGQLDERDGLPRPAGRQRRRSPAAW